MRLVQGMMSFGLAVIGSVAVAQGYHVTDHWKIGGAGGWDYLVSDDAAHRLYVAHNSRIEVLDTTSGKLMGAVTGLKSTHGIALAPDGKLGYISDGAGNAIVVFQRDNLSTVTTVPTAANPDGIVYEPVTKTVWAFHGRGKEATVLDTATNKVVATVELAGKPESPQVDGRGSVYVNIEDKNETVKLDAATKTVVATWPLAGCESPGGSALDRSQHRFFAACDGGKMAVVDTRSGKVMKLASIGDSPDAAGFDAKTGLAFSSNGEGTLSVIDTKAVGFPTVQTVKTARGARTMALDQSNGRVYTVTAQFGAAPAATAAVPHPRASVVADSFEVIVIEP